MRCARIFNPVDIVVVVVVIINSIIFVISLIIVVIVIVFEFPSNDHFRPHGVAEKRGGRVRNRLLSVSGVDVDDLEDGLDGVGVEFVKAFSGSRVVRNVDAGVEGRVGGKGGKRGGKKALDGIEVEVEEEE